MKFQNEVFDDYMEGLKLSLKIFFNSYMTT